MTAVRDVLDEILASEVLVVAVVIHFLVVFLDVFGLLESALIQGKESLGVDCFCLAEQFFDLLLCFVVVV